jgi:molybdate transport system ATP-binding protein
MMALSARIIVSQGSFGLDVDLAVAAGERIALVGPNGAGKTTLLRAVCGLTPIDSGRIEVAGRILDDPSVAVFIPAQKRRIGMVFQDFLLFPHLSAIGNVAYPLRAAGMNRRDAEDRAQGMLIDFGLAEVAHSRPSTLSGGEAQRVALLRALVMDPDVVLLDEPMAALDAHVRPKVRESVLEILRDRAVVLVTHDADDVVELATRVVVLEAGRIAQQGTVSAIQASPATPFAEALFGK